MEKEKYASPEAELVELEATDVIATSDNETIKT